MANNNNRYYDSYNPYYAQNPYSLSQPYIPTTMYEQSGSMIPPNNQQYVQRQYYHSMMPPSHEIMYNHMGFPPPQYIAPPPYCMSQIMGYNRQCSYTNRIYPPQLNQFAMRQSFITIPPSKYRNSALSPQILSRNGKQSNIICLDSEDQNQDFKQIDESIAHKRQQNPVRQQKNMTQIVQVQLQEKIYIQKQKQRQRQRQQYRQRQRQRQRYKQRQRIKQRQRQRYRQKQRQRYRQRIKSLSDNNFKGNILSNDKKITIDKSQVVERNLSQGSMYWRVEDEEDHIKSPFIIKKRLPIRPYHRRNQIRKEKQKKNRKPFQKQMPKQADQVLTPIKKIEQEKNKLKDIQKVENYKNQTFQSQNKFEEKQIKIKGKGDKQKIQNNNKQKYKCEHILKNLKSIESHGKIRQGKQFQSQIPEFISNYTDFNLWRSKIKINLLERRISAITF